MQPLVTAHSSTMFLGFSLEKGDKEMHDATDLIV